MPFQSRILAINKTIAPYSLLFFFSCLTKSLLNYLLIQLSLKIVHYIIILSHRERYSNAFVCYPWRLYRLHQRWGLHGSVRITLNLHLAMYILLMPLINSWLSLCGSLQVAYNGFWAKLRGILKCSLNRETDKRINYSPDPHWTFVYDK